MRQRSRALLFSWTGAALVLASLGMMNVVASLLYTRLDFSAGRIYSISPGTKTILKNAKDDIVIKTYFTPNMPPPYGLNDRYVRDLLGEYKSAGKGKVVVEFLNPEGDEVVKREAMGAGVSPVRLSIMASDKFEIKEAFMGLVILYAGKTETIPIIQDTSNLEYDITRRIKKLTQPDMKTVGFVTGHGEKSAREGNLTRVFALFRQSMKVSMVSLDQPVPPDIEALWIYGPTRPFAPAEIERLKAWVGAGKTLGILLDRRSVQLQSFTTGDLGRTGLEPLLESWGVKQRKGFVVDAQAERIQLESRQGMFTMMNVVEYPYIPIATNFNKDHQAVRGLDGVSFPFVHPLEAIATEHLEFIPLIHSSESSWYDESPSVSPYETLNVHGAERGPFVLAAVIEGDFYKVTPTTSTATAGAAAAQAPGRVIVVGTSRVVHPSLSVKPANIAMLLNLIEWSLQDEALLSIRAKGVNLRFLKVLPDGPRFLIKYALVLTLPLVLLLVAFWSYRRQKSRRGTLPSEFA